MCATFVRICAVMKASQLICVAEFTGTGGDLFQSDYLSTTSFVCVPVNHQ